MPPMRPEFPAAGAGPTGVHVSCDCGLAGSCVKIRKLVETSSAVTSPRPLLGTGLVNSSAHDTSDPVRPATFDTISSVHVPVEFVPANAVLIDSCGLNRPKNGAPPFWMG